MPDIVHAHDWQAGLVPPTCALSGTNRSRPSSITIHNIAFQGLCSRPRTMTASSACRASGFDPGRVEYYGSIGFLKAGLQPTAHWITTVSPTYASEIRTPEFGYGPRRRAAHRRSRPVTGILNGIDTR